MMVSKFDKAFAAARREKGAGKTFTYNGKSYSTDRADDGPASPPTPPKRPSDLGERSWADAGAIENSRSRRASADVPVPPKRSEEFGRDAPVPPRRPDGLGKGDRWADPGMIENADGYRRGGMVRPKAKSKAPVNKYWKGR